MCTADHVELHQLNLLSQNMPTEFWAPPFLASDELVTAKYCQAENGSLCSCLGLASSFGTSISSILCKKIKKYDSGNLTRACEKEKKAMCTPLNTGLWSFSFFQLLGNFISASRFTQFGCLGRLAILAICYNSSTRVPPRSID